MFQIGLAPCEQQTISRPLTRSRPPLIEAQSGVRRDACASWHAETGLTRNWMVVNHHQFLLVSLIGRLHSGSDHQFVCRRCHPLQFLGPKYVDTSWQSGAVDMSTSDSTVAG